MTIEYKIHFILPGDSVITLFKWLANTHVLCSGRGECIFLCVCAVLCLMVYVCFRCFCVPVLQRQREG